MLIFEIQTKNMMQPNIGNLEQFILRQETSARRVSQTSRNVLVGDGVGTNKDTVLVADRAILAVEHWWIQHNASKNYIEFDIVQAIIAYFDKFNARGVPLMSREYLNAHMKVPFGKEFYGRKYTRLFRKAVQSQFHWVHNIFKYAPVVYVNHALHNFSFGELERRMCPFVDCCFCNEQPRTDQIFWFVSTG